jgi:hypothetical protein
MLNRVSKLDEGKLTEKYHQKGLDIFGRMEFGIIRVNCNFCGIPGFQCHNIIAHEN